MQFRSLSEKYFQVQQHIFSKQTPRKPSCSGHTTATVLKDPGARAHPLQGWGWISDFIWPPPPPALPSQGSAGSKNVVKVPLCPQKEEELSPPIFNRNIQSELLRKGELLISLAANEDYPAWAPYWDCSSWGWGWALLVLSRALRVAEGGGRPPRASPQNYPSPKSALAGRDENPQALQCLFVPVLRRALGACYHQTTTEGYSINRS